MGDYKAIEKLKQEIAECEKIYPNLRHAVGETDEAFLERQRCFRGYLDRKKKELEKLNASD